MNSEPTAADQVALVHTIARLARLEIGSDEATALAGQFTSILQQFRGLASLDVTEVEPLVSMSGAESVTRADVPEPSFAPDLMLAAAPERDGDFYRVPKTVGGEE
ncbi:MAG: Asp-tRNA(Asn)/Glu-tRNA(Gln) amidotransferase subunit GatC [Planctomycetes bacterium]|nr:Asp-tRNA(Asn)/Glu-tRNA(Gln) amidotransferase subunit GatC [Planctomycetota bacterium]